MNADPAVELEPQTGWLAEEVAQEFPALRLVWISLDARPGKSPRELKQRLRGMSSRFRGSHAVAMRQSPVPWAYRVFFRQIGLDPDADRTPVEAAALDRLIHGAFRSRNLLDDALLASLVDTGVPIWALDSEMVSGRLGVRLAEDGEPLGRAPEAPPLPPGRLVVADERSPLAILFGDLAPGHGVTPRTSKMTLFAVQVAGVPEIHVEEALHTCVGLLR